MGHGGRVFQAAENLGISPYEILDFSANINAFFDLSAIKRLIEEHLDYIHVYPDPDLKRGRDALAEFLHLPTENVAVGNGASHLIHLLPQALRPKKVLIPVPTFSEYERGVLSAGAEISFLRLQEDEGFCLRAESLLSTLDPSVDMVILCNPNNPTGQLLLQEELEEIERHLRKDGTWLVVDEAFIDFVPEQKRPYLLEKTIDGRVVLLRSPTKCLAIPGLRLGYLAAPRTVIHSVIALTPPWSVNCFAQLILENFQDLYEVFKKGLPQLFAERNFLKGELGKNFKVFPSEANFLLFKSKGFTSTNPSKALLKHRILVRDCMNFRGLDEGFTRVAVRGRDENLKLIKAIREVT
ncbi:MAG: aminotransferase class I/II-fold pyridoxal phosphate-dependent enzyme [Deltaproteobacteria bacterium]|nr:aminotransferase class I/II-fold pyridoxal phosphate-dependent enzyme [Deltaproteobacteria bacterium]